MSTRDLSWQRWSVTATGLVLAAVSLASAVYSGEEIFVQLPTLTVILVFSLAIVAVGIWLVWRDFDPENVKIVALWTIGAIVASALIGVVAVFALLGGLPPRLMVGLLAFFGVVGAPIGVLIAIGRDITQRKAQQRALEEYRDELETSNERLQEFAYIASHDLQEPLRMVSSYVELLEREYGDELDGEAEEYMEFAIGGAKRMKTMINSLLEYSRVHSNAGDFEVLDSNDVFENCRQDLKLLIDEHDADVSVGDLPTVEADPSQLGQAFQNLVKNSLVHAGETSQPTVEVTATERDDAYEFAVADDGPGIPEAQQEDIFEIFYQGSTAPDSDTSGIGLAVTQRIVHRHGGKIWVESDAGEGTTFRFTIPKAGPTEKRRHV